MFVIIVHNKDIALLRDYRYYNKLGKEKEINKIKKKRKALESKN